MLAKPQTKDRPNTLWPIGTRFTLLDAYMRNPIAVKRIDVRTTEHWIVAEDNRGVRHYAHTDRICSDPPKKSMDYDDLLGIEADSETETFEELL